MRKILLSISVALSASFSFAQITSNNGVLTGEESLGDRYVQSAVPFLTIAPDARAAGMADAGVATSPDANASHWNASKLVFTENPDGTLSDMGASLNYTPWLRKLIDDMSLNYLSFYKRLRKEEVVSVSMNYFDLGDMKFRDENNVEIGDGRPRELSLKVDYARQLSENMSVSLGLKWIHSNLTAGAELTGSGTSARAGNSIAADLGFYWNKDIMIAGEKLHLGLGGNISNLGSKITYTTPEQAYFIPTNLRLGGALTKDIDLYNKITLVVDFNKLMVPTPAQYATDESGNEILIAGKEASTKGLVSGVFGSFADAPGGFSEEISEFTMSTALEYWYADAFAARAGYFHEAEAKGNRKFFTLGAGVKWKLYAIDFAYLVPISRVNNPLRDTIRLSLQAKFKSKKKIAPAPGGDA